MAYMNGLQFSNASLNQLELTPTQAVQPSCEGSLTPLKIVAPVVGPSDQMMQQEPGGHNGSSFRHKL